jgi:hypothetical protein
VIQWEPAWDPRRVRWRGTDDGAAARQVWLGPHRPSGEPERAARGQRARWGFSPRSPMREPASPTPTAGSIPAIELPGSALRIHPRHHR